MADFSAADVKALRDRTGAGMMACRDALVESSGDLEKAVEILRAKGEASAAKRAGAETREGAVQSYIHAGNKIGVMVEVDCQTDFVARNEEFVEFARDLALHIAAAAPIAISEEDVPSEDREREERIATEQAADRPENVRRRSSRASSTSGWTTSSCYARSTSTPTSTAGKTIEDLRRRGLGQTRENIVIRRFARFAVGG